MAKNSTRWTGAGIAAYREKQTVYERSIGMGTREGAYDAELEALVNTAEWIHSDLMVNSELWRVSPKVFRCLSDHSSAVNAIC